MEPIQQGDQQTPQTQATSRPAPVLTVNVPLDFPTSFDGVVRDSLTLRRPKVKDMRAAHKLSPTDENGQELALFAILAGVAPHDLEEMDLADYNCLQDSYFRFRPSRKDITKDAQKAPESAGAGSADVAG